MLEVVLVHRPKYDDWSIPKGKLDPGESVDGCALREVEEETGLRCELGRELGQISYADRKGRPKIVHYWEMDPIGGHFSVNAEVDQIAWVPLTRAASMLTYRRELPVLAAMQAFEAVPLVV